jgi:hypothetical protein
MQSCDIVYFLIKKLIDFHKEKKNDDTVLDTIVSLVYCSQKSISKLIRHKIWQKKNENATERRRKNDEVTLIIKGSAGVGASMMLSSFRSRCAISDGKEERACKIIKTSNHNGVE